MKMNRVLMTCFLSSVMMTSMASPGVSSHADSMPGARTMMCATMCHSSDSKPSFPSLAQQDEAHVLKSMEAFQRMKQSG
ncbi:MAG: hypothetical protein ACHQAX_02480 [Gammaproteobacteria bacterium]